MSEARDTLMVAAAKVKDLAAQIEKLEAAENRASHAVEEAEGELEKHADVEGSITRWRVDQVKAGADTRILPANLQSQLDTRKAAEDELARAQSTHEAIGEELAALRHRLKPLESEKLRAAIAVLHERGEGLVCELEAVNQRRSELVQLLQGLGSVQIRTNGPPESIGYPNGTRAALEDRGTQFPGLLNPIPDCGQRWAERLNTLLADPAAEITTPLPLAPSDYSSKTPVWPGPGNPWPQTVTTVRPETPQLSSCAG